MDRLALVAPGITPSAVQQQLSAGADPAAPSTAARPACPPAPASSEDVAMLEQLLAGDADTFDKPAANPEQAAATHQEDLDLLRQLNTEDGQW
jgi:hypothetical protein